MNDKQKNKWLEETKAAIAQLGQYRQAFAFGAIQVFKGGKLALKETMNEIDLWKMKPHLTDEAFYEIQLDQIDKVHLFSFLSLHDGAPTFLRA